MHTSLKLAISSDYDWGRVPGCEADQTAADQEIESPFAIASTQAQISRCLQTKSLFYLFFHVWRKASGSL